MSSLSGLSPRNRYLQCHHRRPPARIPDNLRMGSPNVYQAETRSFGGIRRRKPVSLFPSVVE